MSSKTVYRVNNVDIDDAALKVLKIYNLFRQHKKLVFGDLGINLSDISWNTEFVKIQYLYMDDEGRIHGVYLNSDGDECEVDYEFNFWMADKFLGIYREPVEVNITYLRYKNVGDYKNVAQPIHGKSIEVTPIISNPNTWQFTVEDVVNHLIRYDKDCLDCDMYVALVGKDITFLIPRERRLFM